MTHSNGFLESSRHQRILRNKVSQHAIKRSQQRGIKDIYVSLILDYGSEEHDGMGGIRYLMNTRAMKKLYDTLGKTPQISSLKGKYAVVSASDGTVITISHRDQ